MLFSDLKLSTPVLSALEKAGYRTPTPIQEQAIPHLLNHKDVLACAQTGTGKTAAFSLPIIELMLRADRPKNSGHPQALVVCPTRELAIQIAENVQVYTSNTKIGHAVVFGGVSQNNQVNELRKKPEFLIATPGRLLDLIEQGFITLKHVEYLVLDEADRMLDMGFVNDIKKIIKLLPLKRHTMLFSATMPDTIMGLAKSILNDPVQVAVTPVSSTVEVIEQRIFPVDKPNKINLLQDLVKADKAENVLVFSRTKHGADNIVRKLRKAGIPSEAIHGNKSQPARQNALNAFKSGKIKVLVATDIAARGIDIDALQLVINFDLPNEPETYVHRIGRTGRAGASGRAWSFCSPEEIEYLRDIQKLTGLSIPMDTGHDYIPGSFKYYEQQLSPSPAGSAGAAKGSFSSVPASSEAKPRSKDKNKKKRYWGKSKRAAV